MKRKLNVVVMPPMKLMPCAPNVCQVCAVDHDPKFAHNADSLYYQVKFQQEHGRWPTWGDAIAHCEPGMQEFWKQELRGKGVPAEKLVPSQ